MEFIGKLTIQLHSGKDLKDVKHFGIMSPYAIIYIAGADGKAGTKHKTNIVKGGDSDPVWDFSMVFNNVSLNKDYNLVIKIKHGGTIFDRKVGKVKVPLIDLLAVDYSGDSISYRVMTKAGETQGVIILSHSFTQEVERFGNIKDGTGTSTGTGTGTGTSNSNSNSNNVADDESGKNKHGKAKKIIKKAAMGLATIVKLVLLVIQLLPMRSKTISTYYNIFLKRQDRRNRN